MLEEEQAKAEARAEEQATMDAPVAAVEERIRSQLEAAGQAPDVAAQHAALHAANARVLQSKGIDPQEVYANLDIRTEAAAEPGAVTFEQSASIRRGDETLKKYGLQPGQRYKVRDVAAALEARQREKYGTVGREDRSTKTRNRLAGWIVAEALFELEENPGSSGVGWYTEKFQRALDLFADQFPELADQAAFEAGGPGLEALGSVQGARDFLTALFAVTSDGQRVADNFNLAVAAYKGFRETGRLDAEAIAKTARRQASVAGNLENIQTLLDQYGPQGMRDFLLEERTVKEINAELRSAGKAPVGGYKAETVLPNSAAIFGAKLGAFYANLMGSEGYLTMDLWWTRSFNRYRGDMFPKVSGLDNALDSKGRPIGLARFKKLWAAERGLNTPWQELSDDEALAALGVYQKTYEDKGFKDGTEIEKAANTLHKAAFKDLQEQPFNASDRAFMIDTVKEAQKRLAKQGHNVSIADIQAILWYYEKRLYGELTGKKPDDISYEEVARQVTGGDGRRAGPGPEAALVQGVDGASFEAVEGAEEGFTELEQARSYGQPPGDARGSIQFYPDQTVINLGRSADLSTFLHESGHLFVRTLTQIAPRDEQAAADLEAMIRFAGVETAEDFVDVEPQEKVARAFEAYLREGKAPSVELQGAFRRFRSWLMLVYRKLTQLDVELNDEIRGVFDRMLATEEEITAAEQASNFEIDPAISELMDEPAQRRYNEAAEAATAASIEELERRKIVEELRETYAWWKAEKAAVEKEVARQLDSQPVYQAIAMLRDKDNPVFLARDAVEDEHGPEVLKKVSFLTRKEDGVHPDIVADTVGMTSGDELIKAIIAAPARGQALKDETARIMEERHGTLLKSKRQAVEAAGQAVHGDERAKFLAVELRALAKRGGKAGPVQVIKRVAQQLVESRTVQNAIKVGQYRTNELKAARRAQEAVSAGDYVAATNAKREQLLNHYLYMESLKAKEEVEKHLRYFKKFDKKGTRAAIDPDYLDQIDGLLERHEMRKVPLKTLARRKSLAKWIEERTAEGDEVVIPEELGETLSRVNYKEMSLEQLRGLKDAVQNIEHLGRLKTRLLTDKKKREMQEAADAITSSIRANNAMRPPEPIAPSFAQKIKGGLSAIHAEHTKLEFLFHRLGGEKLGNDVWTLLFKPIADAEALEQEMISSRVIPGLNRIFGRYSRRERARWMSRRIYMPELGESLTKANVLALALNMGNEDNQIAVYEGFGMDPETAEEGVWRILGRHMTKKDWDTVQQIWDHIDTLWPDIAALQKRLAGVVPEKVERTPVKTPFGVLAGGYYPLKADSRFSHKAFERQQKEGATTEELFSQNWMRPQTKKGHTIERVGFGKQRVSLDLNEMTTHLTNVVHDLTHREALMDVDRLSRRGDVREAITSAAGRRMYALIRPWLTAVAGDRKEPAMMWERTLGRLRAGATVVNMGLKVTTAIVQPMGYFNSVERLGVKHAAIGLRKFYSNPLTMQGKIDFVMERSVMMQNRQKTFDRDIRDALKKMKVTDSALYEMRQTFFYFTGLLDMSVSMPTWLGAYEQGMAEFQGDEARAVDHADSTVRMTQSAGGAKDLAAIQRGGETMRIFTMFYSYFSVLYNQFAAAGGRTKSIRNVPSFIASMMWLWFVPSILSEIVAGRGPEDDADEEDILRWTGRNLFSYPFQTVIGLRDVVNATSQQIEPNAPQYGYSFSPVVQAFEQTTRLSGQIAEGELDRQLVKASLMTVGYWAALPARQAWITGEYLYDYATGEETDFSLRDMVFQRRK
jgi:hypothetical protein